MTAALAMPLVEAKGLTRVFDVSKPWLNRKIEGEPKAFLKAVTGISFTIGRRETRQNADHRTSAAIAHGK